MTIASLTPYDVFQWTTVGLLVAGCTLYCLLALAPDIIRQPLGQLLLRCPLPAFLASRLRVDASACGVNCGACAPATAAPQTVKWHPRKR